jgi:hypothetical protein
LIFSLASVGSDVLLSLIFFFFIFLDIVVVSLGINLE